MLEQKDYSKLPVFTSNLTRSPLTSSRMYYDWADIYSDLDNLADHYHPQIGIGIASPDYLPPESVLDVLVQVGHNQTDLYAYQNHQYTGSKGHPRLLNIIAKFYSSLMKRKINQDQEILITVGASNALILAMQAFLDHGDQVIVFEPFYPDYRAYVNVAGGKLVYVPLREKTGTNGCNSNDWTFDKKELESKINRKTKMILLNNPNNPYGKSYTLDELIYIAYLAEKNDLVVISDEAAEWYIYDKPGHIKIASLPGMFQRTVTISSGGKMFWNTGWRIGWAIAPEDMLWAMTAISESTVISVATPLQIAYAMGLEIELKKWGTAGSWWNELAHFMKRARDRVVYYLKSVGADYVEPTAGYCIIANFTRLANQIDLSSETDCRPGMRFVNFLMRNGINPYPGSIFFGPRNQWRTEYVIRLTNMKNFKTIDAFGHKLQTIFNKNQLKD